MSVSVSISTTSGTFKIPEIYARSLQLVSRTSAFFSVNFDNVVSALVLFVYPTKQLTCCCCNVTGTVKYSHLPKQLFFFDM